MAEQTSPKVQSGVQTQVQLVQDTILSELKQSPLKDTTSAKITPYVPTYNMSNYFQGLGFFFLFLALLWLGVRLLKRYGRFSFLPRSADLPKDALRLEAQLPIGPRKGLMVVRFLHKRLLLGVTDQQISVLTWERVDDAETADFAELLEQADHNNAKKGT